MVHSFLLAGMTCGRDNVGLLVDSLQETAPVPLVVFLTNDLTDKVMTEALSARANLIVSYHPTPFR